jgi:hypothetical protein
MKVTLSARLKSGALFCITMPPSMKLIYASVDVLMPDVLRMLSRISLTRGRFSSVS